MSQLSYLLIALITIQLMAPAVNLRAQAPQVIGQELLSNDKEAVAVLERQGFVVKAPAYRQIYHAYYDRSLPPFITSDSILRTFQIIYEDSLIALEEAHWERLSEMTRILIERSKAGLALLPPEKTRAALMRNLSELEMVSALLSGSAEPGSVYGAELALIEQAESAVRSPLLGETVDYRAFKLPSGLTNAQRIGWYRVLRWLERWSMNIDEDDDARCALLLVSEFVTDERLSEYLKLIDAPLLTLAGSPQTLSVNKLLPSVKYIFGKLLVSASELTDVHVATFQRLVKRVYAGRNQFHLLGPRDQIEPRLLKQLNPKGIDSVEVALLFGLDGGREKPAEQRVSPRIAKAREELLGWQLRNSTSLYSRLIDCYRALLAKPRDARLPRFFTTPAWQDKSVNTVLASWAVYHRYPAAAPKQAAGEIASIAYRDAFHGYVEPNGPFYAACLALANSLVDSLRQARVAAPKLDEFITLVSQLERMVEKELSAIPFSEEEIDLLETYGERLAALSFVEGNYIEIEAEQGTLVMLSGEQGGITMATGRANTIYVIVNYRGERYLCKGGVNSFFQLTGEYKKFSEEQWQAALRLGLPPPPLPFQKSFLLVTQ